jgi:hypothetical protein
MKIELERELLRWRKISESGYEGYADVSVE